jgi:cytosine/adenosine deaminase-related metal-dependent hydrolase
MRARETGLVQVGVSPHAPYSVSAALYGEAAAYARAEHLRLATHVAESEEESRLVTRGEGDFAGFLRARGIGVGPAARSPVSLLEACDVLGPNALLIHCVRVDAGDIAAIVAHGCGVAACPLSNAYFGHGPAPVGALRDGGVRLGVGSDSMASNDVMDVLAEAAQALRESSDGQAGPDPDAVWELATIGGARALGMEHEIGSLDPGKQADLAVFPVPPGTDPATFAARAGPLPAPTMQASHVIVGGRVILGVDRWRPSPPIH